MTTISIPINLPHTEAIGTMTRDNGDMVVRVKSTETGTCCKSCGKTITKFHSLNKTILLNHLPAFGNPVYIELQPIRFQCLDCKGHPTTTQKLSWYQIGGKCTELYAKYIINLLVNNTITDVVEQENISYKRVESIIKKFSR
jgi:transposase